MIVSRVEQLKNDLVMLPADSEAYAKKVEQIRNTESRSADDDRIKKELGLDYSNSLGEEEDDTEE